MVLIRPHIKVGKDEEKKIVLIRTRLNKCCIKDIDLVIYNFH